jgi:hypothetical protein
MRSLWPSNMRNWPASLSAVVIIAILLSVEVNSQATSRKGEEDPDSRPPLTRADLEIVQRAQEILDTPAKWNRADTRVCPPDAQTYSIYCALQKATVEVMGEFKHRGGAMQEMRFVIDEIAPNHDKYHHRLMDYNNDPTTTFEDVRKAFMLLEQRIVKQLSGGK